jgi:endoglucanase
VRIPWSNELYETDPIIDASLLAANPDLVGMSGMQVLDAVIDALAGQGLVVILSNHVSRADWCCSNDDGNGLWYTDDYPESSWIADWRGIVRRYAGQPAVVGADLRNEPRSANGRAATWGGDPATDWRAAAERGGNAVLEENPNLLVVVEGVNYALDLRGVYNHPVSLAVPNKLVYSAHDYGYDHPTAILSNYFVLTEWLGRAWGYIVTQNRSFTAPLWVGEIGTCHGAVADCMEGTSSDQARWFSNLRRYLGEADFDWSYWALNGTQSTGRTRSWGAEETYGILDTSWQNPASHDLLARLQAMQRATQGP